MRITAHCVVKNEDIWVWFAIMSVLPFVDKVFIYDTGSTDKTVDIVKSIGSDKIIFEERGEVDKMQLVRLRQEQLEKTKTDWFLILDGDEIWPQNQLLKLFKAAEEASNNIVAIFNHVRNCIGDIYHFLPEDSGDYKIAGVTGNLNTRLIKKTKYLKILGEYPLETYQDQNGPVQSQASNIIHSNTWYLHTSFLKRSTKVEDKVSGSFGKAKIWQKGLIMDKGELPEVLRLDHPDIVADPYIKRGVSYEVMANILNPLIDLKKKARR